MTSSGPDVFGTYPAATTESSSSPAQRISGHPRERRTTLPRADANAIGGGVGSAVTMRTWFVDGALAVAVAVVSQLEIWAPHAALTPGSMPGNHAAVAAAYLVAALALAFRSRFPLGSVAVICVSLCTEWILVGSPQSFGSLLLLTLPAYSVAARSEARRAVAAFAMLMIAGTVWTLTDPADATLGEKLSSMVWLFPVGALWLTGLLVGRRSVAEERRVARLARLEHEERARQAIADERARIARELHDAVGHSVSIMTVQASAVRRLLHPDQQRELEALTAVEKTGREALDEMRRMVGILRRPDEPPSLVPQPGLDQIEALVQHVQDTGLEVELRVEGQPIALPMGLDLTAYRLVQEGLTNVLKHAHATRAEVVLRYLATSVEVEVSDDGVGGETSGQSGHGLIGMHERVSLYQGQLSAGPIDGGGYALRARLPLPQT